MPDRNKYILLVITLIVFALVIFAIVLLTEPEVKTKQSSLPEQLEQTLPRALPSSTGSPSVNNTEEVANFDTVNMPAPFKGINCLPMSNEQLIEDGRQLETSLLTLDTPEAIQMLAITGFQQTTVDTETEKPTYEQLMKTRLARLEAVMNDNPDNKLVSYHLVDTCAAMPKHPSCSAQMLNRAIALDGSNGALWANIAAINLSSHQAKAALGALELSATAPEFNDYRPERLTLFVNVLALSGLHQGLNLIAAIGFDAAIPVNGTSYLFSFCNQSSVERDDITQVCLKFGERLARDANNYMLSKTGLEIQKKIYLQLKDELALSKITKQIKILNKEMSEAYFDDSLLFNNQGFSDYWLLAMQNYNELDANKLVKKEADRITSDPDYEPCPGFNSDLQ